MFLKNQVWLRGIWITCSFLCAFLFLSVSPLSAAEKTEPVRATLVAENSSIAPGYPFWVAVELKMEKGWDTYWLNPGDSGFPTQVNWNLPEGFTASSLLWPYPEKFVVDSLVAFGYQDNVLLMSQITPPKTFNSNQPIKISADVTWLACKESCIPGKASLTLTLPVSETTPAINPTAAPLFAKARKALPQKEENLTVVAQADRIVLKLKPQPEWLNKIEGGQFIPEQREIIDYMAPQNFTFEDGLMTLSVKRVNPSEELGPIKGVLLLTEQGSHIKRAIEVDSTTTLSDRAPSGVDGVSSVAVALSLAFLGGLILNVMPCVLPVVALKIFGFVKMAQQRRGLILQHGGIFALGVLISFWVLSGALLVLRAYGEGIGWGFQLQEPVFVVILTVILFLLGLSLFGVFEIGTSLIALGSKASAPSQSYPLSSSFMSGVLATLVATPCTGPLLGPALGFAMTLPAFQALAIFTAMGLGMAFPYLLFSAFPHLVRFLPKPGNWMLVFKQMMGFLMMATVVWLLWVFGAQTDHMATFVLLFSLLLTAIGAWIFGKWAAFDRKRVTRLCATLLAGVIILTSSVAAMMAAKQYRDGTEIGSQKTQLVADSGWEAYSPERVAELRNQGIPVFVDFTAKWCLICQANKVVLRSADMQSIFKEMGIVTMVADWTKRDPVITQELEKLGRSGVPVYVLYPGSTDAKPLILPQTLTSSVVKDYLDKIKPSTTMNLSQKSARDELHEIVDEPRKAQHDREEVNIGNNIADERSYEDRDKIVQSGRADF